MKQTTFLFICAFIVFSSCHRKEIITPDPVKKVSPNDVFPAMVNDSINLLAGQDSVILVNDTLKYILALDIPAGRAVSNIQIAYPASGSSGFHAYNIQIFNDGPTQRMFQEMTGMTQLRLPVTFSGSGNITLQAFIVWMDEGMVIYPAKTIIWN